MSEWCPLQSSDRCGCTPSESGPATPLERRPALLVQKDSQGSPQSLKNSASLERFLVDKMTPQSHAMPLALMLVAWPVVPSLDHLVTRMEKMCRVLTFFIVFSPVPIASILLCASLLCRCTSRNSMNCLRNSRGRGWGYLGCRLSHRGLWIRR